MFLLVWAKNQLGFEICVKLFEFKYKNLNEILIFSPFLSNLPGPLSFDTAFANNTIFLQQFFRFRGGAPAYHINIHTLVQFGTRTHNLCSLDLNDIRFSDYFFPVPSESLKSRVYCTMYNSDRVHLLLLDLKNLSSDFFVNKQMAPRQLLSVYRMISSFLE